MASSPTDLTPPPAAGAIFLSYAREDADVARRIAEALRATKREAICVYLCNLW